MVTVLTNSSAQDCQVFKKRLVSKQTSRFPSNLTSPRPTSAGSTVWAAASGHSVLLFIWVLPLQWSQHKLFLEDVKCVALHQTPPHNPPLLPTAPEAVGHWDIPLWSSTLAYCIHVISVFPSLSVCFTAPFIFQTHPNFFSLFLWLAPFFSNFSFCQISLKFESLATISYWTSVCFSTRGKYWFVQHNGFFIAFALLPKADGTVRWICCWWTCEVDHFILQCLEPLCVCVYKQACVFNRADVRLLSLCLKRELKLILCIVRTF